MARKQVVSRTQTKGATERVFTLTDANRALVLVRRIVQDVIVNYAKLMDLRVKREELSRSPGAEEELFMLQGEAERLVHQLNRLNDELLEIGCVLKDWGSGLVDFPGTHQGRKVWLCWKLGEDAITYWHEFDEGFRGRKPITPAFE